MRTSNKKKTEQLGMPFGTAAGRLRLEITFHLLTQLKQNNCFVCALEIKTSKELSIEHKEPWLDNDTSLFWNLDNIAFSHRKCNKPNRQGRPTAKCQIGQFWCPDCNSCKDKNMFSPNKTGRGVKQHCKPCRATRAREGKPI